MFSPATRRKRDLLKDTVNKAKDRYRTVSDSKTTGWDFFNKNKNDRLESLFYFKDFGIFGKGGRSGLIPMIFRSYSERVVNNSWFY